MVADQGFMRPFQHEKLSAFAVDLDDVHSRDIGFSNNHRHDSGSAFSNVVAQLGEGVRIGFDRDYAPAVADNACRFPGEIADMRPHIDERVTGSQGPR